MVKIDQQIPMGVESLRTEFRNILNKQVETVKANHFTDRSSTAFSSTITDSFSFVESLDSQNNDQFNELRRIVQDLDSHGYNIGEYVEFYKSSRRFILDEKFRGFGIGKCSIDDVRTMDWEMLDPKIKSWNRAARLCFKQLFVREKVLYEQIFGGLRCFEYDEGFLGIVCEFALHLIHFAQGISFTQPSIMKLFEVLDVYESLSNRVLPTLNAVFVSNLSESVSVCNKADQTIDLLAKYIRKVLQLFESSVLQEKSNISGSGGIIKLTEFAMSYVTSLVQHKEVLVKLIVSQPTTSMEIDDDLVYLEVAGKTPFELHVIWIIRILKYNLKGKSEFYKEVPLRFLFMMNNVNYIVQKIRGHPELQEIVGREYIDRLSRYVSEAADSYKTVSWGGVLHCLRDESLQKRSLCTFWLSKSTLKNRLKSFNAAFNGVCQDQSTWVVQDAELRGEVHRSILDELTPAYNSFLGQNRSLSGNPVRHIRYTVNDLEGTVHNLFVQR
ncbi:exocyst complex component EXO70C2 [Daucus carota subsp. sativus]|nr:PREDICTED: exocyst complex component EXO70A1 [Daucus carota subsp. sativus]